MLPKSQPHANPKKTKFPTSKYTATVLSFGARSPNPTVSSANVRSAFAFDDDRYSSRYAKIA